MSDGSNWIIIGKNTSSNVTTISGLTIGATTTAPTKATIRQQDFLTWSRQGKYALIHMEYVAASSAGRTAGSGDYLFQMPSNMLIDTTLVTPNTTVGSPYLMSGVVGTFSNAGNTNYYPGGSVSVYSTSQVRFSMYTGTVNIVVSSSFASLNVDTLMYGADFKVPIQDWQP